MSVSFHKKYKAKKGWLIVATILFLIVLPIVLYLFEDENPDLLTFLLIYSLPMGLLFWMYFDTSYQIMNDKIYYRCAFLKGEIEIASIKELEVGATMYVGLKPALAFKGIIIKYGKYDDIYIAPENNDELANDLLAINPSIVVKNHVDSIK
jgi:hypothetical protein